MADNFPNNGPPPKPFDFVQASFWLVAAVIAANVLIVFLGVGMCLYYSPEIVAGKYRCDADAKLSEMLAAALAAALGFAGGRMSK